MGWEWDEDKRQENIRKHGIDFRDVPPVFDEPMLNRLDERHDYGEDRWIGIGLLQAAVVVVVYTEPQAEVVRLISARRANRYERLRFQESFADRLGPPGGSFG